MKRKTVRKAVSIVVAGTMILAFLAQYAGTGVANAAAEPSIQTMPIKKVIVDGKERSIPNKGSIVTASGNVYISLQVVSALLGKPVVWVKNSSTLQIGPNNTTPSPKKPAGPQEFTVIYDDFTKPLSVNWDLNTRAGNWTIDPGKGAHGDGDYSFIALSTKKYIMPNNYTIECELLEQDNSYDESGVFIKGSTDILAGKFASWPMILFGIDQHANRLAYGFRSGTQFVNIKRQRGVPDKMKVVVNGSDLDVYINGEYITSDQLSDEQMKGKVIGMISFSRAYVKSFKITNNDKVQANN